MRKTICTDSTTIQTKGLQFKEGVIVDATVVTSSRRPRKVIESAVVDREELKVPECAPEYVIKYSDDTDAFNK